MTARLKWRLTAPFAGAILAAAHAAADPPGHGPWAEVSVEFESENTVSSDDPELELSDTFATIESDLGFAFGNGTGFRSTLTFEPVLDPEGDRFFQDFGLYAEEIYLYGAIAGVRLRAGKLNPWFDLATDYAPGLYGDDLAGEYELTERIGAEAALPLLLAGIDHTITVSGFMADRSVLSDSLFTRRGRLRASDGGPSNTDYPKSIAAALTGRTGQTIYNLGGRFQAAGASDERDESGFVAGVAHEFSFADTDALIFAEAGHFENFGGDAGSFDLVNLAAEVDLGPAALTVSLAYGDGPRVTASHLAALSLEAEIRDNLAAEIGYRFLDDEGTDSHTIGIVLSYQFSLP